MYLPTFYLRIYLHDWLLIIFFRTYIVNYLCFTYLLSSCSLLLYCSKNFEIYVHNILILLRPEVFLTEKQFSGRSFSLKYKANFFLMVSIILWFLLFFRISRPKSNNFLVFDFDVKVFTTNIIYKICQKNFILITNARKVRDFVDVKKVEFQLKNAKE